MKLQFSIGAAGIWLGGWLAVQAPAQIAPPVNPPEVPDLILPALLLETNRPTVPAPAPGPMRVIVPPVVPRRVPPLIPPPARPAGPEPLAWDATAKEYRAKTGETNATITFNVTNISSGEVVLKGLMPSCGCTVAKLPSQPWRMAPGTNGQIHVTVDLRGKRGTLNKFITVDTSSGFKLLSLKIVLPDLPVMSGAMDTRGRNLMVALADRQAVFKNDCAKCHAAPAVGKSGKELFQAVCAICHESPHRASMVPNLRTIPHPNNRGYWQHWITTGKVGTLMPAFAQEIGGPLTPPQIQSLVDYLITQFESAPLSATPVPPRASSPAPIRPPPPPSAFPRLPVAAPAPVPLRSPTNSTVPLPPMPGQ